MYNLNQKHLQHVNKYESSIVQNNFEQETQKLKSLLKAQTPINTSLKMELNIHQTQIQGLGDVVIELGKEIEKIVLQLHDVKNKQYEYNVLTNNVKILILVNAISLILICLSKLCSL